jgi:type IV secretory pathway component VirB8
MNFGAFTNSKIYSPVLTYIDNYDEIAFIRKLELKTTNDPNLLIANYLVEKYVTIRESYKYSEIEEQKLFIENNSTSFLSLNFDNYMNISNIKSPMLLYGQKDTLNIVIRNVYLKLDDANIPTRAKIEFDVYKNSDFLSNRTVEMEFYMSDILSLKKDENMNFEFSVFKYNLL